MKISVKVPASSANLGSGVDTMGIALSLYLRCSFEEADTPSVTFGQGFDRPLPDADNYVLTAARALFERVGLPFPTLAVTIDTDIPLARGLGSSSAALVAGLWGANRFLPSPFPDEVLLTMAAEMEGHPDNVVPAALGGFTLAMSAQGELFTRRFPAPKLRFVAAIPAYRLSTEKARRALPESVPLADAVAQLQRACFLSQALAEGDFANLKLLTRDELFTPARAALMPGSAEARQAAVEAGALCAWVSGAGPTVLAPAEEDFDDIAMAMISAYRPYGIHAKCLLLEADNLGVTARCED